jgi:hypothetical protein
MPNDAYYLMCNDTRLAVLEYYEMDHPWVYCHFVADPTFAAIQPLFEESNRLRNIKPSDQETWLKAYEKIAALDLYVLDTNGRICKPRYIHIKDGIAWFRKNSDCFR